jgi:hypothetical protein
LVEGHADRREQLLKSGWAEVHVIEPDRRFQPWDYESVAKADGGGVYIVVEPDAHVTVHKGFKPRSEMRRGKRKAEGEDDIRFDPPRALNLSTATARSTSR